jgi:hypothetical protein
VAAQREVMITFFSALTVWFLRFSWRMRAGT